MGITFLWALLSLTWMQRVCDPIRVGNFIRSVVRSPVNHVNTLSPNQNAGARSQSWTTIPVHTSLHVKSKRRDLNYSMLPAIIENLCHIRFLASDIDDIIL